MVNADEDYILIACDMQACHEPSEHFSEAKRKCPAAAQRWEQTVGEILINSVTKLCVGSSS